MSIRTHRAGCVAVALLFLPLVAAACSGTTTTSARPAAPAGTPASAASTASATSAATLSVASPAGGTSADIDACSLMTVAQASSLVGTKYTAATPQTIASGQDQCTYTAADYGSDLQVIVYQPSSGVSWQMATDVPGNSGTPTSVSGVGDNAEVGAIELDARAGDRVIAVIGAGGSLAGTTASAVAVAKAVIAALP